MWSSSKPKPSTNSIRGRDALTDVDLRDRVPVGGSLWQKTRIGLSIVADGRLVKKSRAIFAAPAF